MVLSVDVGDGVGFPCGIARVSVAALVGVSNTSASAQSGLLPNLESRVSWSARYFWLGPAVPPLFEFPAGPGRATSFPASAGAAVFRHDGQRPQ